MSEVWADSRLTLPWGTVALWRRGAGQPLVYIPGTGGAAQPFPVFDRLAARHDVIVVENPGFGRSDDPVWTGGIEAMALAWLDILDALDLRDVTLCGGSIGGWIAAEVALRDSARLRDLVLVAPAGLPEGPVPYGRAFDWTAQQTAQMLFSSPEMVVQAAERLSSDQGRAATQRNRPMALRLAGAPLFCSPDLPRFLHRLRLPVTLVWGSADRVIPFTQAAGWQALVQHARLIALPDCGHLPQVEAPEGFLAAFD